MSITFNLKTQIQNLQDSELIRLFLDFVQTYQLQYQKINKEISYKCYEATWILSFVKATGYGRTQSEAYKHALKNLFESLIEDEEYQQFIVNGLKNQSRPSLTPMRYSMKKESVKTEGSQNNMIESVSVSESKEIVLEQTPSNFYSKKVVHQMSTKKNPAVSSSQSHGFHSATNNHNHNNSKNKEINHSKICLTTSTNTNTSTSTMELIQAKEKMKQLEQRLELITKENQYLKQQIGNHQNHHQKASNSKISTLSYGKYQNHLHNSSISNVMAVDSTFNDDPNQLLKYASVQSNQENCYFKQKEMQIDKQIQKEKEIVMEKQKQIEKEKQREKDLKFKEEKVLKEKNRQQQKVEKLKENQKQPKQISFLMKSTNNKSILQSIQSMQYLTNAKTTVPKLKLDILPNYHKKCEKSLNESLLASYYEKHGDQENLKI